jgi:ligand-binding SRPBCC domain-containing protein
MMYKFQSEHWVPASVERVFQFFANPRNLPSITPPAEGLRIEELHLVAPPRHPLGARIHGVAGIGSEIALSFCVRGVASRRVRWQARIVDFEWNRYFIETQVEGPMKFWTHRHSFKTIERDRVEGTLIQDDIEYGPRFGLFGMRGDASLIRRSLGSRFEYRRQAIEKLLPPLRQSDLPLRVADQLRKVGEQLRRLSK